MTKHFKLLGFLFVYLAVFCIGCKEPFEPEISSFDHSILVVEGYIEVGGGKTSISMGRTRPVYDSVSLLPTEGAIVTIEGENGEVWPLSYQGNGSYLLSEHLPENLNYRLSILTEGNKYLSQWVTPIITPEISDISFEKKEGDVNIYTSTVGNERARYFLWQFEETWMYESAYRSYYKYDSIARDMVALQPDELTFQCWQSDLSKQVILASSERYDNDYIYQKELLRIDSLSEKLGKRYSILVRQKAIDKEAFAFWEAIRKNSDDIGGIFSPLPSLVESNLYNVDDLEEPVIGYISAGKSAEKRIYINRNDVAPWSVEIADYNNCGIDTILRDEYRNYFEKGYYVPVFPYCEEISCPGFFATTEDCIDCSVRGGKLQKPEFWQN